MDEQEKLDRLREIRLIVTEVLMFLAVVMLVGFLTLIVTGYSFNLKGLSRDDEELVERTGLVQVGSLPTGATIMIDGEAPLLLRTNGSRAMRVGEHTITLTKDGYDTWQKTVRVAEGMMYRVNYPRLFLKEREAEEVLTFEKPVKYVSVSPNKEKMLVVQEGKTYLLELNTAKPALKLLYEEEVADVEWSGNSERILAMVAEGRAVLSVKNAAERTVINETTVEVKFETEAGERLLVLLDDKTLREIDVKTKITSEPLAKEVIRFDNDGDRVVYLTRQQVKDEWQNQVRTMRVGAEDTALMRLTANADAQILTMRYFTETYFGIIDGDELKIYYAAAWPETEWGVEKIFEQKLSGELKEFEKRGKGMVFALELTEGEKRYAEVFDIEALKTIRFD